MKTLQYQKVAQENDLPAVVRLLAKDLAQGQQPYFAVGKWLLELSLYDLNMLNEMAEELQEMSHATSTLILLAELLASAEGIDILDIEGAQKRTSYLITILLMESLFRKGAIELKHCLISFGDDEMKIEIARPKGEK